MPTVSEFLIERMENAGIKHVFGVPGDYVLNFYKKVSDSDNIELVNNTDENHAGFAADAYARIHGIGCVCVTYNVGALKIANAVACAYAERSPLVVISGSPGMKERAEGVLLHHMVRSFECQKEIFDNITCASTVLDNPNRAGYEIDRVFEALNHHKQPIYIELPRDVADKPIAYDVYKQGTPESPQTDQQNLDDALEEVSDLIKKSSNPVIMAGVQLARYGLGSDLIKFAEKANIPIATTLLSKSIVSEKHPLFLGLYMGDSSEKEVQEAVENSDCLLMFGVLLTDMTLSFMPAKFKKRNVISSSVENLRVKSHMYESVQFKDFCGDLFKSSVGPKKPITKIPITKTVPSFTPKRKTKLTTARFFEKINSVLNDGMAIVADVGDALLGAADLVVHHNNSFVASAFYTSMGTAIPGVLGVQLADPGSRVIGLVGDGSFQMSCTELSTLVEHNMNPIVFVMNNKGYTTERFLKDGPFNDIVNWEYHKITNMIGGGTGVVAETEDELEAAVEAALKSDELFVINVLLDSQDISPALRRLTNSLSNRI
jgi:indolepyruvate decarboxylase